MNAKKALSEKNVKIVELSAESEDRNDQLIREVGHVKGLLNEKSDELARAQKNLIEEKEAFAEKMSEIENLIKFKDEEN